MSCLAIITGELLRATRHSSRTTLPKHALPFEIVMTLGVIALAWTGAVVLIHSTRIVQRVIDILIAGSQQRAPGDGVRAAA